MIHSLTTNKRNSTTNWSIQSLKLAKKKFSNLYLADKLVNFVHKKDLRENNLFKHSIEIRPINSFYRHRFQLCQNFTIIHTHFQPEYNATNKTSSFSCCCETVTY